MNLFNCLQALSLCVFGGKPPPVVPKPARAQHAFVIQINRFNAIANATFRPSLVVSSCLNGSIEDTPHFPLY